MAEPAPFSNLQTPEQIALNRKLGQQLMMQGMSVDPVGHWTQGLARVLQAGVGRMHVSDADNQQQQRSQAMMGALQRSPTFAGLSPEDRNIMGMDPEMMKAVLPKVYAQKLDPTAGMRQNLLEEQIQTARQNREQSAAMHPEELAMRRAQVEALTRKDAMDQVFMNLFQPPSAPAQSPIRPQSYAPTPERPAIMTPATVGVAPQEPVGDPMLIRTQAAPGQPQGPAVGNDPVIEIPGIGKMPRSQAEKLGLLLAYKGKGDAGKMIMDAAKPGQLGKEARNEIDKNEVNLTEQLGRLREIRKQFKPEFLTYEEQAKQYGISWLDKFDATRANLTPEQLAQHSEFSGFRRNVTDNLNRYIKEITGAAMGVEEAKRIISSMPNENDGPTQFIAKLKATERAAELAVARARVLRRDGFNGQPWDNNPETAARAIPLERMKSMIIEDSKRVYQQIRQQFPQAEDNQIKGAVRAHIRSQYGMDI